jgi:TP901 family phage tail tape measure protein
MPTQEQEAKIRLTAVDDTAKALNACATNFAKLERQISRTFNELEKNSNKAANSGIGSFTKLGGALGGINSHLGGMASRFLGVGAAIETARRSFLGFAEFDHQMRLMQNQAGATREQIEYTGESIHRLAQEVGVSAPILGSAFNQLREELGLTLEETEAMFPKVAKAARSMGTDVGQLSTAVAQMMRNMEVPAEDLDKVLDSVAKGVFDLRLNAEELTKNAPKLSEAMSEWGIKGAGGINETMALLGSLQKVTGNTGRSAMLLSKMLEGITDPDVSKALTGTAEGLQNRLRAAQAEGKSAVGVYIGMISRAKDRDAILSKFSPKERAAIRILLKDYKELGKIIDDQANSAGTYAKGYTNVMEGPKAAVDRLIASVDTLGNEMGALLDTMGATTAIKGMTDQFQKLRKEIKVAKGLWDYLFNKGEYPEELPQTDEEWDDLMMGPKGNSLFGLRGDAPFKDKWEGERTVKGGTEEQNRRAKANSALQDALEKKARERLQELGREAQETGQKIKQMSMALPDSSAEVRIWKASIGGGSASTAGPGGARVVPASYSPDSGVTPRGNNAPSTVAPNATTTPPSDNPPPVQPGVGPERGRVGKGGDPRGMEAHIRETAKKYGIDPDTAVAVAKSEGLTTFQSSVKKGGKGSYNGREDSWGAFQLYMGGGLGNQFQKETGLDPRDPANEKATIDFALKHASKNGWGSWYGARNTGIPNYAGIGGRPGVGADKGRVAGGPPSGGPPSGGGEGLPGDDQYIREQQSKVAGIRKGALSDETKGFLRSAGIETGLRADVYSGGQRMHGAPGSTGSHRHDSGGAGDLKLWDPVQKRYLNSRNPEDAARMEAYTAAAVKAGATGVGHGPGYMGPESLHIGGGKAASWGGSSWIERARRRGMAMRGPGGSPVVASPAKPPVAVPPTAAAAPPTTDTTAKPWGEDRQYDVPLQLNVKVNDNDMQFARSTLRRSADREVREARWSSYSDIGAA